MITRQQALTQLTASGQPYELQQIEYDAQTLRVFKNAPPSLGALFADTRSDLPFYTYDDERYTFNQAYASASHIARLLIDRYGIVPGDRVAISMRNYPEWVTTFMAITSIGGVAVAMNALWQSHEMEYGLTNSGAKVLFADAERIQRLAGCSDAVNVKVIAARPPAAGLPDGPLPDGTEDLATLLAEIPNGPMPDIAVAPTNDATILYTSGSTGHPKGVVSSHRNIISALLSWELDTEAGLLAAALAPPTPAPQPATLLAVPLFHATGSHAVYLASYRAQRHIVAMYKWDPALAAELIERERIASFIAPAAMTGDLVQTARDTQRDLSTLMMVGGGGAPRAPEQVKDIDASFQNAMPGTGWGMTETNAIGTGIGGDDYLARPESSGRGSAVLDLRIVDDTGAALPAGQRGELQVRGASVFRGYWNRPDADADAFTNDRWLRTGDVAYLDDQGFLFIVDRIKDLVIRGGENIGCGTVEAAILEHPAVLEASAYAVPDDRLGEEVGATVYTNSALAADDLRTFLNDRLARYKVPRYVTITDAPLPRIASGKIFKRGIRDTAVANMRAEASVGD